MRVLMLGWEFPPYIAGGLGTACHGLTRALDARGTKVTFVLPKKVDSDYTEHVRLLTPQLPSAAYGDKSAAAIASTFHYDNPTGETLDNVTFKAVPSRIISPYQTTIPTREAEQMKAEATPVQRGVHSTEIFTNHLPDPVEPSTDPEERHDMLGEAQRYAGFCLTLTEDPNVEFDVIHAHDWMTLPAAMALKAKTGKPLIVQIHSTEHDRSGDQLHQQIYEIERRGLHQADQVIAVSKFTANLLQHQYELEPEKVTVVHNGINPTGFEGAKLATADLADTLAELTESIASQTDDAKKAVGSTDAVANEIFQAEKPDPVVLYLGRITMQKGPEYFVAAARKVLSKTSKVRFIMAGSGDKTSHIVELAEKAGIAHKFEFVGFLRGIEVDEAFQKASVFVMPSVSEPFGIAALEAIQNEVPVIISKTSGVSEVVKHALKVDFWDTDEMANQILAVIQRPELADTLTANANGEVQGLTWDMAADRCLRVYEQLV